MMKRCAILVTALVMMLLGFAPVADAAGSKFGVTAAIDSTAITIGGAVKITGRVTPRAVGKPVTLLRRSGATWVKVATANVSSTNTYRFSVRPTAPGKVAYRVYKPKSATRAAGYSPAVSATVYRWHYLTDLNPNGASGISPVDPLFINGTSYKKSLLGDEYGRSGWREYDLNRGCLMLTGFFGLSQDHSDSGTVGRIEILGDGNSAYVADFGLTDSAYHTVSTAHVLRMRIETSPVTTRGSVSPAIGSPRVYCSF